MAVPEDVAFPVSIGVSLLDYRSFMYRCSFCNIHFCAGEQIRTDNYNIQTKIDDDDAGIKSKACGRTQPFHNHMNETGANIMQMSQPETPGYDIEEECCPSNMTLSNDDKDTNDANVNLLSNTLPVYDDEIEILDDNRAKKKTVESLPTFKVRGIENTGDFSTKPKANDVCVSLEDRRFVEEYTDGHPREKQESKEKVNILITCRNREELKEDMLFSTPVKTSELLKVNNSFDDKKKNTKKTSSSKQSADKNEIACERKNADKNYSMLDELNNQKCHTGMAKYHTGMTKKHTGMAKKPSIRCFPLLLCVISQILVIPAMVECAVDNPVSKHKLIDKETLTSCLFNLLECQRTTKAITFSDLCLYHFPNVVCPDGQHYYSGLENESGLIEGYFQKKTYPKEFWKFDVDKYVDADSVDTLWTITDRRNKYEKAISSIHRICGISKDERDPFYDDMSIRPPQNETGLTQWIVFTVVSTAFTALIVTLLVYSYILHKVSICKPMDEHSVLSANDKIETTKPFRRKKKNKKKSLEKNIKCQERTAIYQETSHADSVLKPQFACNGSCASTKMSKSQEMTESGLSDVYDNDGSEKSRKEEEKYVSIDGSSMNATITDQTYRVKLSTNKTNSHTEHDRKILKHEFKKAENGRIPAENECNGLESKGSITKRECFGTDDMIDQGFVRERCGDSRFKSEGTQTTVPLILRLDSDTNHTETPNLQTIYSRRNCDEFQLLHCSIKEMHKNRDLSLTTGKGALSIDMSNSIPAENEYNGQENKRSITKNKCVGTDYMIDISSGQGFVGERSGDSRFKSEGTQTTVPLTARLNSDTNHTETPNLQTIYSPFDCDKVQLLHFSKKEMHKNGDLSLTTGRGALSNDMLNSNLRKVCPPRQQSSKFSTKLQWSDSSTTGSKHFDCNTDYQGIEQNIFDNEAASDKIPATIDLLKQVDLCQATSPGRILEENIEEEPVSSGYPYDICSSIWKSSQDLTSESDNTHGYDDPLLKENLSNQLREGNSLDQNSETRVTGVPDLIDLLDIEEETSSNLTAPSLQTTKQTDYSCTWFPSEWQYLIDTDIDSKTANNSESKYSDIHMQLDLVNNEEETKNKDHEMNNNISNMCCILDSEVPSIFLLPALQPTKLNTSLTNCLNFDTYLYWHKSESYEVNLDERQPNPDTERQWSKTGNIMEHLSAYAIQYIMQYISRFRINDIKLTKERLEYELKLCGNGGYDSGYNRELEKKGSTSHSIAAIHSESIKNNEKKRNQFCYYVTSCIETPRFNTRILNTAMHYQFRSDQEIKSSWTLNKTNMVTFGSPFAEKCHHAVAKIEETLCLVTSSQVNSVTCYYGKEMMSLYSLYARLRYFIQNAETFFLMYKRDSMLPSSCQKGDPCSECGTEFESEEDYCVWDTSKSIKLVQKISILTQDQIERVQCTDELFSHCTSNRHPLITIKAHSIQKKIKSPKQSNESSESSSGYESDIGYSVISDEMGTSSCDELEDMALIQIKIKLGHSRLLLGNTTVTPHNEEPSYKKSYKPSKDNTLYEDNSFKYVPLAGKTEQEIMQCPEDCKLGKQEESFEKAETSHTLLENKSNDKKQLHQMDQSENFKKEVNSLIKLELIKNGDTSEDFESQEERDGLFTQNDVISSPSTASKYGFRATLSVCAKLEKNMKDAADASLSCQDIEANFCQTIKKKDEYKYHISDVVKSMGKSTKEFRKKKPHLVLHDVEETSKFRIDHRLGKTMPQIINEHIEVTENNNIEVNTIKISQEARSFFKNFNRELSCQRRQLIRRNRNPVSRHRNKLSCKTCKRKLLHSNPVCSVCSPRGLVPELDRSQNDFEIARELSSSFNSFSRPFNSVISLRSDLCELRNNLKEAIILGKRNRDQLQKEVLHKEKELSKSLLDMNRGLRSEMFIQNLRSWRYFRPDPLQMDIDVFPGLHDYFQRVEQGPISREESMNYEWIRLSSLSSYRGAGSAIQLAKHGFYHDSEHGPLATRCYACQLLYTNWEYFDNIEDKHRRLSPNCPLVRNNEPTPHRLSNDNSSDRMIPQATVEAPQVTRVPQTTESVTNITDAMERTNIRDMVPEGFPTQPTEDRFNSEYNRSSPGTTAQAAVFGQPKMESPGGSDQGTNNTATSNENVSRPQSNALSRAEPSGADKIRERLQGNGAFVYNSGSTATSGQSGLTGEQSDTTVTGLNIPQLVVVMAPKHSEYTSLDSRSASFTAMWPSYLDQTPRTMAEAGFFYAGVADFTRCFACGGGLRNWEAGDDPCLEHTRWYPRCEYMNKLKGTRYVQAVIRRQEQHVAEQRRRQQQQQEQRRQAASSNTPQDPLTTPAGLVLLEMGYTRARVSEAILAVRRNTGNNSVNAEQAMVWILDQEERAASPAPASTQQTNVVRTTTTSVSGQGSIGTLTASSNQATVQSSSSVTTSVTSAASSTPVSTSSSQSSTASGESSASSTSPSASVTSSQGSSTKGQGQGLSQDATGRSRSGSPKVKSNTASSRSATPTGSGKNSGGEGKSGDKSEGKDSLKKGPEGEQAAGKQKKRNGKKKGKGKGASENKGGASNQVEAEGPSEPKEIDTQHLKEENKKLREMQTCKICMDKPVNMTLLPCGHLVCCEACAPHLRKCPICRKRIEGSVKTFMS